MYKRIILNIALDILDWQIGGRIPAIYTLSLILCKAIFPFSQRSQLPSKETSYELSNHIHICCASLFTIHSSGY